MIVEDLRLAPETALSAMVSIPMVTIDVFDIFIFAFVVLAVLFSVVVVAVVVFGGLPGRIAARRGHPQAKAVAAAGWINLFTLFALRPIPFIWAFFQPKSVSVSSSGDSRP